MRRDPAECGGSYSDEDLPAASVYQAQQRSLIEVLSGRRGNDLERGDRPQVDPQRLPEGTGGGNADSKAGERGTSPDRDRLDVVPGRVRLLQEALDLGQELLRVTSRPEQPVLRRRRRVERLSVVTQHARARGRERGVETDQRHDEAARASSIRSRRSSRPVARIPRRSPRGAERSRRTTLSASSSRSAAAGHSTKTIVSGAR